MNRFSFVLSITLLPASCGTSKPDTTEQDLSVELTDASTSNGDGDTGGDAGANVCPDFFALKNAYFGDLHAHTAYSLDAYSYFATRSTPLDAYAFARGTTLEISTGSPDGGGLMTTIERPLDFLAITDHSEFLAATYGCGGSASGVPFDPQSTYEDSAACDEVRSTESATEFDVLNNMQKLTSEVCGDGGACAPVVASAWQGEQAAAAAAYVPCQFTSFVAYEWSHVSAEGATLHKNVIFATEKVPSLPLDSTAYPSQEALWNGLDQQCKGDGGCEAITIPHNSNLSKGGAFTLPAGLEAQSAKYQKLVEVMQHKGNSECFYDKSPDAGVQDTECNYEYLGGSESAIPNLPESYIGYGLYEGLQRSDGGVNPLMLGFVGSTDDHNATPGNTREDTWPGHTGRTDDTPAKRLDPSSGGLRFGLNPGGLAVAWAEQNTRDSLFAAFRRRETYATSGTRIRVRFYQTWSGDDVCSDSNFPAQIVGNGGVPMGGTLSAAPSGTTGGPRFVVYAWKDKTDLARIDIVKLWYDASGKAQESIVKDMIPSGSGSARCFAWQDPDFVPGRALYYARVLEQPTPRWSAIDCQKAPGVDTVACADGGGLDINIQERAWTSPIWFAQ